jgi:flagellar biosynthesis protein FlhA
VQPRARRTLSAALRFRAPACVVLSISELPQSQPIEVIAVIGGEANAAPPPPALTDQTGGASANPAPRMPQPEGLAA